MINEKDYNELKQEIYQLIVRKYPAEKDQLMCFSLLGAVLLTNAVAPNPDKNMRKEILHQTMNVIEEEAARVHELAQKILTLLNGEMPNATTH